MLLKDLNKKYKCDSCGYIFIGKNAKLKPFGKGVSLSSNPMLCFKFIDTEGKIIGGNKSPNPDDMILHCPKCETAHLFGFNLA